MAAVEGAKAAAGSRIEELRRVVSVTADAAVRARLRVELAELLRARSDKTGALAELRQAAGEAPRLASVRLALLSAAAEMPAGERAVLLTELAQGQEGPVAVWADAAAAARADNGQVDEAVKAWLELAGDARVPLYRRRAAARKAEGLAGVRGRPQGQSQFLAALRIHAGLTTGRTRVTLLRRAITVARASVPSKETDRAALIALAAEWLEIGGAPAAAAALAKQARASGAPPKEVIRLEGEIARRVGRRAPQVAIRPVRPPRRVGDEAGLRLTVPPSPTDLLDAALEAAQAGFASRARRIAESALRMGDASDGDGKANRVTEEDVARRLAAVEVALKQSGAVKDALLLRRTQLEVLPETKTRDHALSGLAAEAAAAGLDQLARAWRSDVSAASSSGRVAPPIDLLALASHHSPADYYLAAQRKLATLDRGASVEPILALLDQAVAGHPAADDALALGERLIARQKLPDGEARFIELLRSANTAELEPSRRAVVAERLADALERQKDALGALAVLQRALEGMPTGIGASLRRRRTRLLRELGRLRELADALERDVLALDGASRLAAFVERAALLDAAGEPERALDVRLQALVDYPADATLLTAARRRLEGAGRYERSLQLATAAVDRMSVPAERLPLLRDIAVLSEKAARNLTDTAAAWLAVLEIDPDDVNAADAAERLLVAGGEWERCADLLGWAVARATKDDEVTNARRAALLWRLAELRRSRLDQEDEAVRLYGELARVPGDPATTTDVSGSLAAAAPSGRAARAIAMHTARAAVAPTPVDQARALLDRGLYLLDQPAQAVEAERDLLRALDLDPRNVEVVIALERATERSGRWAELGQAFRQKAAAVVPSAAACMWYGAGRASEHLSDTQGARDAYQRAATLDPALREPVAAMAKLAIGRGAWPEAARLLEIALTLAVSPRDKAAAAAELADVVGEHLDQPERAIELLESAAAVMPEEQATLERLFHFNLAVAVPRWEQAGQVLERLLASGVTVTDAPERYFRVGAAAEADGRGDRALTFYSRAYSRNSSHRPSLERLSQICFEKDQWDNAWKATEALLERHRAAMARGAVAEMLMRSALCDLHIAQRLNAIAQLSAMIHPGSRLVADGGLRDVAESWGAMRLEPRLLAGLEGERRARVVKRASEALALVNGEPGEVRAAARKILGAVAVVERRWPDALSFLTALAADDDGTCDARERCGFLITAGDIHRQGGDREAAHSLYERARALMPEDERLQLRIDTAAADAIALAHEITGRQGS